MARILIADDGIEFNCNTLAERPLGGVESSVIMLAETLARRGHEVTVANRCGDPIDSNGVRWVPIDQGIPATADLYIANRGDKLIRACPGARKVAFWTHNPAQYLLKWRYLWKLALRRPVILFIGDYHATTLPGWVPDGGRKTIPYGTPDPFRHEEERPKAPSPRAIFTSNPLRGLDWLLDLWEGGIAAAAPGAELHVFSGPSTYGSVGDEKAVAMKQVLDRAESLKDKGVVVRGPVPKQQLIAELQAARVMLYKGDLNETYCLAVGEAQAMGVPAVVRDLGSMPERVVDGKTGIVAKDDASYAEAAARLLSDDDLWFDCHKTALATQRSWTWDDAAASFEELL